MFYPFFELAARSASRQSAFRWLLFAHVLVVGMTVLILSQSTFRIIDFLGFTLLVAGIVEGAMMLGWRLVQLPKDRSLEALLLSPVPSWQVMLGEQLVGLTLFAFVTLSALPLLVWMVAMRWIEAIEAFFLLVMAFSWGCLTGFGLTWWAYEPEVVRKWGERVASVLIVIYIGAGVLFAEQIVQFFLQTQWGVRIDRILLFGIYYNPFMLIQKMSEHNTEELLGQLIVVQGLVLLAVVGLMVRASRRLQNHYTERNYKPIVDRKGKKRGAIGDHPLSWWAIHRVNEYPGTMNLYVGGAVTVIYALYILFANQWPSWLGVRVLSIFDIALGGVSGFSVMLIVLAAVPAAYQYGLWDSSIPQRCRRLEVFLMSELGAYDYARASWAASWHRGRGYFFVALFLWIAALGGGKISGYQLFFSLVTAAMLVLLYFAIGFASMARNRGSTGVGFTLTILLPLGTYALGTFEFSEIARLTPPGLVFYATWGEPRYLGPWLFVLLYVGVAVFLLVRAMRSFDQDLRNWYSENHGKL